MIKEILSLIQAEEPELIYSVIVLSFFIYMLVYLLVVRYVMGSINKKIAQSPNSGEVQNATGIYAICILFWPAALVLGKNYLSNPETARTGRVCIIIFLWSVAFVILASIATVTMGYMYLPEIIELLKEYGFWQ